MPGHNSRPMASDGLNIQRIAKTAAIAFGLLFFNKLGLPALFFSLPSSSGAMIAGSQGLAFRASTLFMLGVCTNVAFVPKIVVWTVARFLNLFLLTGRFVAAGNIGAWAASPTYIALTVFCPHSGDLFFAEWLLRRNRLAEGL